MEKLNTLGYIKQKSAFSCLKTRHETNSFKQELLNTRKAYNFQ